MTKHIKIPEILAPAGDMECFLAALAAGADGIYLGLKNFSARMAAKNFGIGELARLVELAHLHDCRVYVAMNNLIKDRELEQAFRLTCRLADQVCPDGLIIQDLAMVDIARQAGFAGSIALSTLANVTSPKGLETARKLGADRVIVPRELSIDELRMLGENCPEGLELECFVQGALCYCVSGRCYWSSYLGGRSGLRGRCTQPCRRKYARLSLRKQPKKAGDRLFSCQDLELAPAIRPLLSVPNLVSWKIEGRKKGPHHVYHAVTAYKILRDNMEDAAQRKLAGEILEMALGRPGVRARFLPQKANQPMAPQGQTASGLLAGKIRIQPDGRVTVAPHFPLMPGDLLRVGAEDENWHATIGIKRSVPKFATLVLDVPRHKTPQARTPVYLIDRKDPELKKIIGSWREKLAEVPERHAAAPEGRLILPKRRDAPVVPDMLVMGRPKMGKTVFPEILGRQSLTGVWLGPGRSEISRTLLQKCCFWLPPAIWPDNEERYAEAIGRLLRQGAIYFVCNAPWQRAFFPEKLEKIRLVAGPFCNIANTLAILELARLGYTAAFVAPELPKDDILALPSHSPLPLGIILKGFWPVGVSRFGLVGINGGEPFQGQGGEIFWSLDRRDLTWIFPSWPLDISAKKADLEKAGYKFFGCLVEQPPREMPQQKRESLFNWAGELL